MNGRPSARPKTTSVDDIFRWGGPGNPPLNIPNRVIALPPQGIRAHVRQRVLGTPAQLLVRQGCVCPVHRMGDATVNLYLRETGRSVSEGLPVVRFAGFRIHYPLGPRAVRGADNWNWGIETKVGAKDNNITPGYGLTSALRHGLTSDVSDYDRGGVEDLWAGRGRVREGMR